LLAKTFEGSATRPMSKSVDIGIADTALYSSVKKGRECDI